MKLTLTRLTLLLTVTLLASSCANSQKNVKVIIHTSMGDMTAILYNETPQHRDNFVKLAKAHVYDSLLFHRVINTFMIQTGDPNTRNPTSSKSTINTKYTLPAEIVYPQCFHKKGALAAARQGDQVNPEKRSSGTQFYIVQGRPMSNEDLYNIEQKLTQQKKNNVGKIAIKDYADSLRYYNQQRDSANFMRLKNIAMEKVKVATDTMSNFEFPMNIREVYKTVGGTPDLDSEYTVFGEVIEGLDIIDKIAATPTDPKNRPVQDVRMWVEIVE